MLKERFVQMRTREGLGSKSNTQSAIRHNGKCRVRNGGLADSGVTVNQYDLIVPQRCDRRLDEVCSRLGRPERAWRASCWR